MMLAKRILTASILFAGTLPFGCSGSGAHGNGGAGGTHGNGGAGGTSQSSSGSCAGPLFGACCNWVPGCGDFPAGVCNGKGGVACPPCDCGANFGGGPPQYQLCKPGQDVIDDCGCMNPPAGYATCNPDGFSWTCPGGNCNQQDAGAG